MAPRIDHLMWGVPDLDAGVQAAEELFGVTPVPGGSHPGLGTRNALLGLGDGVYLEVLGPDPAQDLAGTMGEGLQRLEAPALVTFAVATSQLVDLADDLRERGYRPRGPVPTQRTTPEGEVLAWDLLFVGGHSFGGLCPFFIDWRDSPHPSATTPVGARLQDLALGSPDADVLAPLLADLHIPVTVTPEGEPWLRATFTGAFGDVVLSSVDASIAMRFA